MCSIIAFMLKQFYLFEILLKSVLLVKLDRFFFFFFIPSKNRFLELRTVGAWHFKEKHEHSK